MIRLIYIALFIRIATNIQQWSDAVYFIGRDAFELILMYYVYKHEEGYLKDVIQVCMFSVMWNMVKPLFTDVRLNDWYEILGCLIGILFVTLRYAYKRFSNRYRK